jgi:uncharacterized SAM-binding protein YcdF (DUF218 family)
MSLIADIAGQAKPILTTLLMPPAGGLFLILLGMVFAVRKNMRMRRFGLAVQLFGVALLWVLSCNGAAVWLGENLLPQVAVATADTLKARGVQAIVVLGGGTETNNVEYASAQLSPDSIGRARYGFQINKSLDLPMAFTGGAGWSGLNNAPSEAQVAQDWALAENKKAFRWLESNSRDTAQNARQTRALLLPNKIDRIALVTHAWHMPRSVLAFEKAGFTVIAAPMGFITTEENALNEWLPSASGMRKSRWVLREKLGLMLGAY